MYFYYHDRKHPFDVLATKATGAYSFYLGPLLALPIVLMLVISPWQFLRKSVTGKTGFLLAVCGATLIGAALPIYFSPHYVAPITAAIYALFLQAMRHLRVWRWHGKPTGLGVVRAIPAICVLLFLLRAFAPQMHIPTPVEWTYTWESEHFQNLDRAQALARLDALPGGQLVFVRFNQYHDVNNEWVYNLSNIDAQKVVWARDMGDAGNAELIRYYPQRRIWIAEPDVAPPRLSPYHVPVDHGTSSPVPATPRE
jgi:hypothetical protein